MEIRKSNRKCKSGMAIIEFDFDDHIIFVFPGTISQFDILVKYKKDKGRIRTPKHIHWVVDVLMKMQAKKRKAREFLKEIQKCWNESKPLKCRDYDTLKTLIENGQNAYDIEKYKTLDCYGEFSVEFLFVLMELLAVQEKTNRPDAYMFGSIIDELLETDLDLFSVVSTAGFSGRNKGGK